MIQPFTKDGRLGFVPPEIDDYAATMSAPETPLRKKLAEETRRKFKDDAVMMIGPQEAAFLQVLVKAIDARCILEIGTFTGYSAIAMAEAAGRYARVLTFESNPEHAAVAQRYFNRTEGIAGIHVFEQDAHEIRSSCRVGGVRRFDLAFIDAEKTGYIDYWQKCKKLVRKGGLLIADNTLSHMRKPKDDPDGKAIAEFNEFVRRDRDVHAAFTTVRDGMIIAFKK